MSLLANDLYRFDEFELSRSRRTLLRNGQSVALLPKTFEVLSCLVTNPGRVVSKEEILKSVWPSSFVEENNLTQHISLLRKALADRSSFIVTIPGRGYQFTADVAIDALPSEPGIADSPNRHASLAALPHQAHPVHSNGHALTATNGHAPHAGVNGFATAVLERPPAPPPIAVPRLQALRRAIPPWAWYASAALLLGAAATAGVIAWKHWRNPPQRRSVLVADFVNSTGDATFDRTLKRALEIDLEQSPFIDVMSEREAMSMLALMGRAQNTDEASPVTADIAREICVRANRRVLLTGSILPMGREYLLTVEATDCNSGRQLTAAKAEAGAKEKVLAALDTVADRVRRGLGEPDESMQSYQVPIMQATTASLDALRSYSIGQSMDAQGKNETETLPFYQRAVELDPQFAMAYGAMANEYYNLSEPNLAAQFYKKAFELSNRVSAKEKLILQAHYYSEGLADMEQGIDTYRQWTQIYPNDWAPWVDLANDYTQIGQYDPAIVAGRQALRIQPDRAINYSVLARALTRAGQFADAQQVGAQAIQRAKDSAGLHATLYEMAVAANDATALARESQWAAANSSGWYGWFFPFERAESAAAAGHRKQADDLFETAWSAATGENLQEAADDLLVYQAAVDLDFGLPDAARAALGRMHNRNPDSADLAVVRIRLGDLSAAERFVAAHSQEAHPGTLAASVDLPRVRAQLAIAHDKPMEAVAALEPSRPYELASFAVPTERAEAWLMANHPDYAAAEYRKILANPGVDPLSPLTPMTHLGLARALARQNKPDQSRAEYDRFFAQWKDADPDLPVLTQARAEYTHLTAIAAK
jgi:DNA-binding winged helix-turn-helix (wHTH) protein/tetratricopeptide (TPR) repeat protein